jgi:hypothetical protein
LPRPGETRAGGQPHSSPLQPGIRALRSLATTCSRPGQSHPFGEYFSSGINIVHFKWTFCGLPGSYHKVGPCVPSSRGVWSPVFDIVKSPREPDPQIGYRLPLSRGANGAPLPQRRGDLTVRPACHPTCRPGRKPSAAWMNLTSQSNAAGVYRVGPSAVCPQSLRTDLEGAGIAKRT